MISWLCVVCFGLAIGLLNVATSLILVRECHVSEQRILFCPFGWLREKYVLLKSLSVCPIFPF